MNSQRQTPALHASGPGRAFRRNRRLNAGLTQILCVVVAVALGFAVPEVDVGFTVNGEQARVFLTGVGAAIVPFIGLVYSLLFLVVQFGTTTFTPRLNIFRDSPIVWQAFAFFTAVLVYCFTAAFVTGSDEDVSGLIPLLTIPLVLVTLAVFRKLQTSAFSSIQLAAVLSQVTSRGREVILGIYPEEIGEDEDQVPQSDWRAVAPAGVHEVRWRALPAVLQVIDVPRLLKNAEQAGVLIECVAGAGDTIPKRGLVALVHGEAAGTLEKEVIDSMATGPERTFEQDPTLAFRVLADIALRALSPAVNDPTTASQALDTSDSLLRLVANRNLDVGCVRTPVGVARLILHLPQWEDYVAVSLDEVIDVGLTSLQVRARLERLLVEVAEVVPSVRRPALELRLSRVRAGVDPQGGVGG